MHVIGIGRAIVKNFEGGELPPLPLWQTSSTTKVTKVLCSILVVEDRLHGQLKKQLGTHARPVKNAV